MKTITVIIPVRLQENPLYDDIGRINRICETIPSDLYAIMISNHGSDQERMHELDALSEKYNNVSIVTFSNEELPFSIGEARDQAVRQCKTPVFMFHDLDFLCEAPTYQAIHNEISARELTINWYDFFTIPTLYLNDAGTKNYLDSIAKGIPGQTDIMTHSKAMRGNLVEIQNLSIGSSALVCNRQMYLASGGHDPFFYGHGAEDFEFYNRLCELAPSYSIPKNYQKNIPGSVDKWEGFRAYFSLLGMELWMRGIFLVHLNHPRREKSIEDYNRSKVNFNYLNKCLTEFKGFHDSRRPLTDPYIDEKSLCLLDFNSKVGKSILQAYPLIGDYVCIHENIFESPQDVLSYVEQEGITQILMPNPYGNARRLEIYKALRRTPTRVIVFDRGALPDSWFFDDRGFLSESDNYAPEKWDVPISEADAIETQRYISSIVKENQTLEKNGSRFGAAYWATKLGVEDKKVIFVPGQRPRDTATMYFGGACGSAAGFIEWIKEISHRLDHSKYALVFKSHPLEGDVPNIPNMIIAPSDANIYDLIELSEKVIVINSGSGLLAAAMKKPVIVCGDGFYRHDGICWSANTVDEVLDLILSKLVPDHDQTVKFIHYLRSRFYSFGRAYYTTTKVSGSSASLRLVYRIDFREIRNLTKNVVLLGSNTKALSKNSFILRGVQEFDPGESRGGAAVVQAEEPDGNQPEPEFEIRSKKVGKLAQICMWWRFKKSDLFDEAWYLSTYSDVAKSGVNPILHYIRNGHDEGRNPSQEFNTIEFFRDNPDLLRTGGNALNMRIQRNGRG
ncbi:hypothetical protein [Nioella sp.]|uniref:capsular polysaccharide export protein, LipB/KpsS family n=1 Tax=Nioella sp. TaxID=1912091 RepID=UPI003A8AFE55